MVNRPVVAADTPGMDQLDVLDRRQRRDRLVNRVSMAGQLSAWVAMASTGLTAGALAREAHVADLRAAQAKAAVQARPTPVPVVVRLVPKPIRTVVVRVPAPARNSLPRKAKATAVRRTVVQTAPRQVSRTAPKAPAPKPASQPAATTSSGS